MRSRTAARFGEEGGGRRTGRIWLTGEEAVARKRSWWPEQWRMAGAGWFFFFSAEARDEHWCRGKIEKNDWYGL